MYIREDPRWHVLSLGQAVLRMSRNYDEALAGLETVETWLHQSIFSIDDELQFHVRFAIELIKELDKECIRLSTLERNNESRV